MSGKQIVKADMNKKQPDKDILNQFTGAERDEIIRLWRLARLPESVTAVVEHVDPEAEWKRLRTHIHGNRKQAEPVQTDSADAGQNAGAIYGDNQKYNRPTLRIRPERTRNSVARTYAFIVSMAALLLGGFMLWYLFVPVSVQAPRGEYVSYEWSDGVRLELNSGSTVTWNRSFGNGHHNLRLHGEAYFEVPSTGSPFVIQTASARIEVLGTRFNVRSWADDPDKRTILTLIDGEVSLASLQQPENYTLLSPGHSSQVDINSNAPRDPEPVDTEQALAWRDHGFYFSSIPMSEVAAELERRYDSQITIDNESLSRRTLTVYLPRPGDLESIIESICFVTDCRFSQENGQVVIY